MEIPSFVMIGVFVICGLALMALEAFIPGVGAAGIAAAVLMAVGIYLCWSAYGPIAGALLLAACAALSFLLVKLVFRSMRNGRLKGVFLQTEEKAAVQSMRQTANLAEGMIGTAVTALRPSGIGEFGGERVHITSGCGFIDAGEKIRIVQIEGARICVGKDA